MSVKKHTQKIIEELSFFVDYENDEELDQLVEVILTAKKNFSFWSWPVWCRYQRVHEPFASFRINGQSRG